jgi:hypothetical protein
MDGLAGTSAVTTIRAVLHVHSTWSHDGHWSLPAIARLYGRLGAAAVLMTEHDTGFDPARFGAYRAACAAASTARCRLIPGIEYSSPDNAVHLLTWGLGKFLAAHRPVAETLRAVRAAGGIAVLAHPVRRAAWRLYDDDWAPDLTAIELWNRKSDGIAWGSEALELLRRTGLPATVGQDFHRLRQLYPLTLRIDAGHEPDDPDALEARIVAALAAGHFTPEAFRRPLRTPDGVLRPGPHAGFERLRRGLRDRIRRRPPSKEQP